MSISIRKLSSKGIWLLLVAGCSVVSPCAKAADFGARVLQEESEDAPEVVQELVGHWRFTKIVFENPRDEHLVLHADGTAENWFVTEAGRSEITPGTGVPKATRLRSFSRAIRKFPFPSPSSKGGWFFRTFRINAKSGNEPNSSGTRVCFLKGPKTGAKSPSSVRNGREQLVKGAQAAGYIARDVQNKDGVLVGLLLEEPVEIGAFQRE